MNLVIVESPTKANTIRRFLGSKYKVLASYGHIRDLPKGEFGIDVENDFKPKYVIPLKARKTIHLLKEEAKKSQLIILATDEDREGEAIAWHLTWVLNLNTDGSLCQNESGIERPYQRIVFHEITKPAIEEALKNPRKINGDLVDAQQARRILDRIVGYKLSPFLWKKVARGLSAGRVQSVAVRLVCEREREIEKFKPEEYWNIEALLEKNLIQNKLHGSDPCKFKALLVKKNGKVIPKLGIKTKKEAEEILKDLREAEYKVANITKKEVKRNPLPPFITSTLQQEAWQKFHWPAKLTMQIAQQLYERGYITYHRSDSLNISNLALGVAKKFIIKNYGLDYYQFRKYKTKSKVAQEAHEAIRPSYPERTPDFLRNKEKLDDKQTRLYELIWQRFIASQMASACFNWTIIEIEAKDPKSEIPNSKQFQSSRYIFRTTGQTLKFDGFLKIYHLKYEENELPFLERNEILKLIKLIPSQHFTQPPLRYSEATLIKELENNGIGRPSTYASILSTIQERNYVEKDENKKFRPTEIGMVVNDLLVRHFSKIVDVKFTAEMEENLDKIAIGKEKWISVIKEFYKSFEKNLKEKYEEVSKKDITEKPTGKKCPKCGSPLLIRLGKYGKFYACSTFPQCKYTEPLKENILGIRCPKCKQGEIVVKRTKKRKIFYGCANWPNCDFALWDKPTGEKCPECGALLIETKSKQIKCSNKNCNYNLKK